MSNPIDQLSIGMFSSRMEGEVRALRECVGTLAGRVDTLSEIVRENRDHIARLEKGEMRP